MERIKKIYQSFSKTERRYLKTFLEAFHTKGENKALQLIELIEKRPNLGNRELSTKLYGNPQAKAFIMLKSRLLDRMLDILSLSFNLQNNPAFKDDPPTLELIEMYKSYTQAIMLRKRGLDELAEEMLKKAAKHAEEQALPEVRLLTLLQLRNLSSSKQEVLWEYKSEIEKALNQYHHDIIGVGYHDEFRVMHSDKSSASEEAISYLETTSAEMEALLETEYSVRAHYYYLNMMVTLHQLREEYPACRDALRELIDLLNSQSGLNKRNRKGIPYLQLAHLEMNLFHFEEAFQASRQALEIFPPKRTNFRSAAVYHLFACLYDDRLEEAHKTLSRLPSASSQHSITQSLDILKYLESCTYYIEGDLVKANHALMEADKLLADKKGWNVGLRIYEIIILLDLEKPDLASARIETLRKHLERYQGSKREVAIYRYLTLLERQSFDFLKSQPELTQLLQQLEGEFTWSPVSHEVVRFDSWIRSKQTGQPYYTGFLQDIRGEKLPTDPQ